MIQHNRSLHATDFPIPDYYLTDGGIYIYSKWKKNRWTVSGGLRHDLRRIEWDGFYTTMDPLTGFETRVDLPDTLSARLLFPAYRKLFHGSTASAGATLQVNSRISLKANIGRAYRAPNINEMAANGLDPGAHIIYLGNKNFNPEFSLQEDIGAMARFKDFSADLSLFNNHLQHYIYLSPVTGDDGQAIVDAQGNKTYQYIQSAAQLYGGEFWLAFHPAAVPGLRIDNSLSAVYGFIRNAETRGKKTDGEYLPLMPPLKWMSTISQTIKPGKADLISLTPKLELEYAGAQNRYFGVNNTETFTPSYILFNIGVSSVITTSSTHEIFFHLQVNNLFDRAYQSGLSRLKYFEHYASSPNGRAGIYNMGRNISFKVILPF
jgi:iron complex outermembrane receptor protein